MHIRGIEIKNFRLLQEVSICLEERTTVIVGRNNTGKTSLTELFRRVLSENSPFFRLEDFSLSVHDDFWKAFLLKCQGREEDDIRNALPVIEVKVIVDYSENCSTLGALGEFIIDLREDCSQALIVMRYQLKESNIDAFFEDIDYDTNAAVGPQKTRFFRAIRGRIQQRYAASVIAVDPNDSTNHKPMEFSKLKALLQVGFINAQRGLDDVTYGDHKDVLGKILEVLFQTATAKAADPKDHATAQKLKEAVEKLQTGIDEDFTNQLALLLPAFSLFGYPGLHDPRLLTETTLDVERLLKDHTKVHYAGVNGINLPEAYNGLGVRNLIFILLKLLEFFRAFKAAPTAPSIQFVFIEEPEVHLHPQMQEVFIRKLGEIADVFANTYNYGVPWPVQFIVTTHSSHIANEAPFVSMRYFLATSNEEAPNVRSLRIKDLRNGVGEDQQFLHKYMTLTRCDLLFADKAILIEGMTERLLLPKMIRKVDVGTPNGPHLSNQYVSVVEVGGAYAHLFFDLLDFLELRTLVITDVDAVKKNNDNKYVACKVSEGTHTSNATIKEWFVNKITPEVLMEKCDKEKTSDFRRIAYQVPETDGAPCGRSFEDAFILANPGLFGLAEVNEESAWCKAQSVGKKSDFALEYAIEKTEWVVPRYIKEGLQWLMEGSRHSPISPAPCTADPMVAQDATLKQEVSDV